jgi:hypothetical protein
LHSLVVSVSAPDVPVTMYYFLSSLFAVKLSLYFAGGKLQVIAAQSRIYLIEIQGHLKEYLE